jgi:hypothetical protein
VYGKEKKVLDFADVCKLWDSQKFAGQIGGNGGQVTEIGNKFGSFGILG